MKILNNYAGIIALFTLLGLTAAFIPALVQPASQALGLGLIVLAIIIVLDIHILRQLRFERDLERKREHYRELGQKY